MSLKVLITGASGLLGRAIFNELTVNTDWNIVGLAYSRVGPNLKKIDLCNSKEVEEFLLEFRPDVVVHSAAERRPDVVENQEEKTKQLNVTSTETIAKVVSQLNAFMLYISTDYVFDGKHPPYAPNAQTNPLNKYGQSKLDGEIVARQICNAGVLRVPILYGPIEYIKESAVTG